VLLIALRSELLLNAKRLMETSSLATTAHCAAVQSFLDCTASMSDVFRAHEPSTGLGRLALPPTTDLPLAVDLVSILPASPN
jgi:hypothetical protein